MSEYVSFAYLYDKTCRWIVRLCRWPSFPERRDYRQANRYYGILRVDVGNGVCVYVDEDDGGGEVVRACVIAFAISNANLLHPLLFRWRLSFQKRL